MPCNALPYPWDVRVCNNMLLLSAFSFPLSLFLLPTQVGHLLMQPYYLCQVMSNFSEITNLRSLDINKWVSMILVDPILQVSNQEPSKLSKYTCSVFSPKETCNFRSLGENWLISTFNTRFRNNLQSPQKKMTPPRGHHGYWMVNLNFVSPRLLTPLSTHCKRFGSIH